MFQQFSESKSKLLTFSIVYLYAILCGLFMVDSALLQLCIIGIDAFFKLKGNINYQTNNLFLRFYMQRKIYCLIILSFDIFCSTYATFRISKKSDNGEFFKKLRDEMKKYFEPNFKQNIFGQKIDFHEKSVQIVRPISAALLAFVHFFQTKAEYQLHSFQ